MWVDLTLAATLRVQQVTVELCQEWKQVCEETEEEAELNVKRRRRL